MAKKRNPEPVIFQTIGELIDSLSRHSGIVSTFLWLKNIEEATKEQSPGLWEQFLAEPVSEEGIKRLADALKLAINDEAQLWSVVKNYNRTLRRGHQLLRLLYSIALDHSLDMAMEDVDGPITFTEQMVETGLVKMTGNKVTLTSYGKQVADNFRRACKNPAEDANISNN